MNTKDNLRAAMKLTGATSDNIDNIIGGYNNNLKRDNNLGCPRCGGLMSIVQLIDGKRARFCKQDRVCLPIRER